MYIYICMYIGTVILNVIRFGVEKCSLYSSVLCGYRFNTTV